MLDKGDIKTIKGLLAEQKDSIIEEVKDIVDFRIEKSEQKMEEKFNKKFEQIDQRFDRVDREINDIIETNQAFIEKIDNHEQRLTKLEAKVV